MRTGFVLAMAVLAAASPAAAQDRTFLGWGRLFNNDLIGDGHDRWRTGSYTVSLAYGPSWSGALPTRPGEIIEARFSAEIIAPADLSDPAPDDRRYVGALTVGAHTHFRLGQAETSAGLNLVATGPQTGLGAFQRNIHDWFDLETPEVLDDQIPDNLYPTALVELGRSYRFGETVVLRPFAELQAGVETYARVGADLAIGQQWLGSLLVRDSSTGQRYVTIRGNRTPGVSFSLGGDIAHVFDSAYLPSDSAATLDETRPRLRAGVHWQGERADVFYGLTWLGKEFEQQDGTQVVGSLRINLDF